MLKKTITYTDYNGVERTEDFYFNLTKTECMKMQVGTAGGYAEKLEKIIQSNDVPELINIFEELVLKAYGEKSDDGKHFRKSPELSKAFTETEAYSELFFEMTRDANAIADFITGILPELPDDVKVQVDAKAKELGLNTELVAAN